MKKTLTYLMLAVLIATAGCGKRKDFRNEDGKVSEDNRNVQAEADQSVNDANDVVTKIATMNGKELPQQLTPEMEALTSANICGASIDSTQITSGIVTMNFDGVTVCNNRKRSGSVRASILNFASGVRWKDAGAVLELVYTNYKITRASDGASIKFNGTLNITNVTGGNLVLLLLGWAPNATNLIHKVEGSNIEVTFDDTKTATWNISRQYTYTKYMNGSTPVIECKGEGLGTSNGLSNLENWGTTRDGDPFTSQVSEPVIWNTTCGIHAPVTGVLIIAVEAKEFELTTTIGVDISGNPVTPAVNTCPYGLKVSWKWKNKTGSKVYKYY